MRRQFFLQDDRSNKVWTVEVDGDHVITSNGRVGARPRETVKQFASNEAARSEAEKQIRAKVKKGYQEGEPPSYAPPDWASMAMTDDTFWRIIGLFNWAKTGDDDAVMSPARRALASMDETRINEFHERVAQKLHALDTEAHAREIGEEAWGAGYMSPDWFLYVRCAVVASGRAAYDAALHDPTRMLKDVEFESLLSLAADAWATATGADPMDYPYVPTADYETFANDEGWKDSSPEQA